MPVDKSWMTLTNRLSREYRRGIKEFLERASVHVNRDGIIRCPCCDCLNSRFQIPKVVDVHSVPYDETTGKTYTDRGKLFNNLLRQQVRATISPSILHWEDVPSKDIEDILGRMELTFNYSRDDTVFMEQINLLMMKALRDWRSEMRLHWKKMKGETNRETPKAFPYKNVSPEDWLKLCDYFGSSKQIEISRQNSANRALLAINSGHGSKSAVAHIYDGVDSVTGELPSVIDIFQKFNYKQSSGWRNDYAQEKYEEMIKLKEIRSQSQSQSSDNIVESIESVKSHTPVEQLTPFKDADIMTQVLGSRSRYQKGVGQLPRLSKVGGVRALSSSISTSTAVREQAETIATLQQKIEQQNVELETLQMERQKSQHEMKALIHQLSQSIPGFVFQSPPPTPPQGSTNQEPSIS